MQNRRNFIRNSLFAVTGAGFAGKTFSKPSGALNADRVERKFMYRTLGKTGIQIPVISMGTGNTMDPKLVDKALDEGVKLLATAAYYQNGNNEKMVGEVIKNRPRDSVLIMTSAGDMKWVNHQAGTFRPDSDPDVFLELANASLRRLQVDYVDIFILAYAAKRESVFFEPLLKAMEKFKKQGKAKYIGIATHKFEHEAIRAAADVGIYDVVMTAYNFRRKNREEIDEALQYATDSGLGIIAMKTMAGVYWDREKLKPINTKASLKWALQNENIHTTVPDCSNYDHLEQDLAVMENMELTEEEKCDLEPPSGELSSGLYCQQCNKCISQCTENLDIPTLMRGYMYAYGYRNLELARHTVDLAGLQTQPCNDCNRCRVNCSMGFDVRGKIRDIARIRDVPEDMIHHI